LEELTYGMRFFDSIYDINKFKNINNVLEVGAGLGHFSESFLHRAKTRKIILDYNVCDISKELLKKVASKCSNYSNINFKISEAEHLKYDNESMDLIISNEVIADLYSVHVDSNVTNEESNNIINKYNLKKLYKTDYMNVGAMMFLEEIDRVLTKNGIAIITEYEELDKRCLISNYMEDHKEISINFDILKIVAENMGFKAEILGLKEFLKIENVKILSEESYTILKRILSLKKLFYSEDYINKVNEKYKFNNLNFEKLENSFKFFKVLILNKISN
jgi:SAM-dependent methyltransferase